MSQDNLQQPERFYRAASMRARYDISDPTLYRYIRSGKIPKPHYVNGQRVWSDAQVKEADAAILSSGEAA